MSKEAVTSAPTDVRMVSVKLPKDRNDKRTHQFVSVNNRNYMVEIGTWVEVPDFVAEVLQQRDQRAEAADAYMAAKHK